MTSVYVLDGVTALLRLKDGTNTSKHMQYSLTIGETSSVHGEKLEEAEDFKCVFLIYFVLESNKIISNVRIVE